MRMLLLLLLVGCAHGYGIVPPPAHAGDRNAKEVREIWDFASESAWSWTAYYRQTDPVGQWPFFAIVAVDGTVCPLWRNPIYLPLTHDYFACGESWRQARP